MSPNPSSSATTSGPGAAAPQALAKSMLQQGDWWLKGQTEFWSRLQAASMRFAEHRQHDLETGFEAWRKISACKDPLEAAEIQQKWLAECAQSAVADWIAIVSPGAEHAAHGRKSTGKPAISVRKASEEVSA